MVFTGNQVMEYLKDPLNLAKVQQHGVDLTVLEIRKLVPGKPGTRVPGIYLTESVNAETAPLEFVEGSSVWSIHPGIYMIYFDQGCKIPLDAKANVVHRSSLARAGATLSSSEYDPGFETANIGAVLTVWSHIALEQHCRVAQIIYSGLNGEAAAYEGRYMHER